MMDITTIIVVRQTAQREEIQPSVSKDFLIFSCAHNGLANRISRTILFASPLCAHEKKINISLLT